MKKNFIFKALALIVCLVACLSFVGCNLLGSKVKPETVQQKLQEQGYNATIYTDARHLIAPQQAGVYGLTAFIVASKHISGEYATGVWSNVEMYFFDSEENCQKYFYSLKNYVDDSDGYAHVMGPADNYNSKGVVAYWGSLDAIEILLTII